MPCRRALPPRGDLENRARQNRVTPFSEIVAVEARGTLMGNRGCLHDAAGRLTGRRWSHWSWVTCRLEFKGRRRALMQPNRYTELFFLDEATAFAAGHRPCGECRRDDYRRFKALWLKANRSAFGTETGIRAMDRYLHRERIAALGGQAAYREKLERLPEGCLIVLPGDDHAWLVRQERLLRWSPAGYDAARPRREALRVRVLTPRSVVRAFRAGWVPAVHPTADARVAGRPGRSESADGSAR